MSALCVSQDCLCGVACARAVPKHGLTQTDRPDGQQRLAAVQFDGTVTLLPMPVLGMSTKRLAGIPPSQVCTCLPSVVLCPAAAALLEVAARLPKLPPPSCRLLCSALDAAVALHCRLILASRCCSLLNSTCSLPQPLTATAGAGPAARRQRDAIQSRKLSHGT